MKKDCKKESKGKTCSKADYAKIKTDDGFAGDGVSKGCLFENQPGCKQLCKKFHRETCMAKPPCPETCGIGGVAQTNFCKDGTTGPNSDPDPTKKAKFCGPVGTAARCPVSCGTCIVESCDDLSTRNPECRLGVTANEAYDAQAKKDKYCTLPSQTKCPVSCMGATIEGPAVCKTS